MSSTDLRELTVRLVDGLRPVADRLPEGTEVRVDRYTLPKALVCPASTVRDEFVWTSTFASRALGLPALSWVLGGHGTAVMDGVREAVAEAIREERSLGLWLSGQDEPSRAATIAAAATWTARSLCAVPWSSLHSRLRYGFQSIWLRPLGFNSPVVIAGRPDVVVLHKGSRAQECILIALGWPDPVVTRLDALTASMDRRRAPLRTVTVYPADASVIARPVDSEMLRQAIDEVLVAAEVLAGIVEQNDAAAKPGRQCWSCDRRGNCHVGQAWIGAQPVRVGGIPIPLPSSEG